MWMLTRFALALASVASVASVVTPTAHAQTEDDDRRARLHFEAGRSHFEEGAYDRARDEFVRAYELSHRPGLLLNLATTHERLALYDEAIENIREYVRLSPDDPNVARLERRVGNLERLRDQRAAGEPAQADDDPEGDDDMPRAFDGDAEGAASGGDTNVQPSPPVAAPSSGSGLMAGAIAGLAAGAVGLVTMGVLGGLALSEDASLRDGCGASASCTADEVRRADGLALGADIGLGVGIVGLAVGTVLLVVALKRRSRDAEGAASLSPWVGPRDGGLVLRGRF